MPVMIEKLGCFMNMFCMLWVYLVFGGIMLSFINADMIYDFHLWYLYMYIFSNVQYRVISLESIPLAALYPPPNIFF